MKQKIKKLLKILFKIILVLIILLISIIIFIAYNEYAWDKNNYGYTVTKRAVYYRPMTFTYHWIDYFKWNKLSTYTIKKKLKNAYPKTFQEIKQSNYKIHYGRDDNNVFFGKNIINDADLDSFQVLTNGFSKDKNNVYYLGNLMEGRDSASFEILNSYYSKDINNVYFENSLHNEKHIIDKADSLTFKLLDKNDNGRYRYAQDKNYFYQEDKILYTTEQFKEYSKSSNEFTEYTSKNQKLKFLLNNSWACNELITNERIDCYPKTRVAEKYKMGYDEPGVYLAELTMSVCNEIKDPNIKIDTRPEKIVIEKTGIFHNFQKNFNGCYIRIKSQDPKIDTEEKLYNIIH